MKTDCATNLYGNAENLEIKTYPGYGMTKEERTTDGTALAVFSLCPSSLIAMMLLQAKGEL